MLDYNRLVSVLCTILLLLLVSCSADQDSSSMTKVQENSSRSGVSNTDDELTLSQQLPLEFELSGSERDEYRSTLNGIYRELTTGDQVATVSPEADPNENCDQCGRETGFFPSPELFIDQFLHVEMKSLTFGLVSWSVDLEEMTIILNEYLGNDAPETLALSYRLTLVRVDMNEFNEDMIELAANGELLSNESTDAISISMVNTTNQELGLTLDHGFSYLLFVNAKEMNTKFTSTPSAPLLIHCFEGNQDQDNGGCVQIITP